ncbi:MAG: glutamate--tRNA ligase, partial [Gammaproteobacteria bacterium]
LQELAEQFELGRLGRAPARFDEIQMQHWQREALAKESPGGLWQWMSAEAGELVPIEDRDAFVRLIRTNILNPDDARFWAEVMYGDQIVIDDAAQDVVAQAGADFFRHALAAWDQGNHNYRSLLEHLKANTGCKGKALFQPLRAALTGTLHGPELEKILHKLPPDRVRTRLMKCIDLAKPVAG